MKKKTNFQICSLILMCVFFLFVSSCDKDDDNNGGIPVLSTTAVTNTTQTTAQSGGNITSDGGTTVTARGVCWSTSQAPTILDDKTTDGTGTGVFSSILTGLAPNTTYYARAYATNSAGTAYGNQISFSTILDTMACLGVTAPPGYGIVGSSGKCWLDRNLGASQVATSSTDTNAYGYLFQWGRAADGHQIRTSNTTSTLSNSDTPGHGDFITSDVDPRDWRSPQNDNLWQGVSCNNNPCPPGWRIPTEAEWDAERQSWGSNDAAGAFASPLKLPMSGSRNRSSGALNNQGLAGAYWSSTVSNTDSRNLFFQSAYAATNYNRRAVGYAVRCIKD